MFEALGLPLLIILLVIFVGGYIGGTLYNLWLGHRVLSWLQKGLPHVGEKAALRWHGPAFVELKITKGKNPFRTAEIAIAMLPREMLLLWGWKFARGQRDQIIFRAKLRAAPHFDLEARSENVWSAPDLRADSPKWSDAAGSLANAMTANYRGNLSPFSINRLIVTASLEGILLTRLAVRRTVPNLEVHFLLPKSDKVSATRVFDNLRLLSEEVLKI